MKQVYRRRYESRRSSKSNCIKNNKIKYGKNDFQYGGWNYYTLQCGTIMILISPVDCTLQRGIA